MSEKPAFGDIVDVFLDVEKGKPIMYAYMLPGNSEALDFAWVYIKTAFLLFFFRDNQKRSELKDLKKVLEMVEKRRVDFGLHMVPLNVGKNVRGLYNWLVKVLRYKCYNIRIAFIDVSGEALEHREMFYCLDEIEEDNIRVFLNELEADHAKDLKGFKESDETSIELVILGPSYLLPDGEPVL